MTSLEQRLDPAYRRTYRWERIGLLFLLLLCLAFAVLVEIRSAFSQTRKTDLGAYLRAGWAVRSGENIYSVTDDNCWHYAYPPVFAIVITPLADAPPGVNRSGMLPYPVSVGLWCLFSLGCLLLAVHWLASTLEKTSKDPKVRQQDIGCRRWWICRIIPMIMCLAPIGCTLSRGQVNLLLVLMIAGMYRDTVRQYQFRSGLWLSAAISLKIIPVFLLLFPLCRRDYRALLGSVCGLIISLIIAPTLVWGPEQALKLHEEMLDKIVAPGLFARGNSDRNKELMELTATDNQSIQAVIHNWIHPVKQSRPPRAHPLTKLVHWAIGGLLTLSLLIAYFNSRLAEAERDLFFLGGLTMIMLIISPVSHTHYFCLALPGVVGTLERNLRPGTVLLPSSILMALICAGLLFALPMLPIGSFRREIGLSLLGCLLLLGLTIKQLNNFLPIKVLTRKIVLSRVA